MSKLYIFCGIPFSGKTIIAKMLEKKLGFKRIDLDDIKFSLFGADIKDEQIDKTGWDKIYKKMYEEIEKNLKLGNTVVNDTGNFTRQERERVKSIADKLSIKTIEVFIDTPIEIAKQRWMKNKKTGKRFDVNESDLNSSIAEMEPPKGINVITYKYPQLIEKWITDNFRC